MIIDGKHKSAMLITLCCALVLSFTGCESTDVMNTPALTNANAGAIRDTMTAAQKNSYIYSYLTDKTMIDTKALSKSSDLDNRAISVAVSDVNKELMGISDIKGTGYDGQGDSGKLPISSDCANYMLTEFARTPYVWKYDTTTVQGYDPATRLYFVDVTYKTDSKIKYAIPDSFIVSGSPNEEVLKKARNDEYQAYLQAKINGGTGSSGQTPVQMLATFTSRWGNPDAIISSQSKQTLLDRVNGLGGKAQGIGAFSYTGIVGDPSDKVHASLGTLKGDNVWIVKSPATMTFRFVMNYSMNIGTTTGMGIKSFYLKDYKLSDSDNMVSQVKGDITGVEVLRSYVNKLILTYHRAEEERDQHGLYSTYDMYNRWDNYYSAIADNTYLKYMGYTFDILGKKDDRVYVKVRYVKKSRANGSNMTYPVYEENSLLTLRIEKDDKLKIITDTLLNSKMTGEPTSVIKGVSGVSDKLLHSSVTFKPTNEVAIKSLITEFSKAQVKGNGDAFSITNYIDTGIKQDKRLEIENTAGSIKGVNKKIVWISGWPNKSNSYCELELREVYITDSDTFDTTSTYRLVNSSTNTDARPDWHIVDIKRKMNVKLTSGEPVSETGALCVIRK